MAIDDLLYRAIDRAAEAKSLLVACAFDGALAPDEGDPQQARAEARSSEALNVLLALHETTVAVVSERPEDEVAELMFLSGAKGGLKIVDLAGLAALRERLGEPVLFAVGVDPGDAAGDDDVVIAVDEEGPWEVEDVDEVSEVLEELAGLRRE